jgi:hypothetical protein
MEKVVVTRADHPVQSEVKQFLQDEKVEAKQDLQSPPTGNVQKTNEVDRGTVATAPDSFEKSSDNKYARNEAKIEGNTISGQRVIESSSQQLNSRSNSNYENNFKTVPQEIIPLASPIVSSKFQPQISALRFPSKGKSEKRKTKVVISDMYYSIPISSLTYGNLNSLRKK